MRKLPHCQLTEDPIYRHNGSYSVNRLRKEGRKGLVVFPPLLNKAWFLAVMSNVAAQRELPNMYIPFSELTK
jgi:hypothetical protein